jgi:hypothetical protein
MNVNSVAEGGEAKERVKTRNRNPESARWELPKSRLQQEGALTALAVNLRFPIRERISLQSIAFVTFRARN